MSDNSPELRASIDNIEELAADLNAKFSSVPVFRPSTGDRVTICAKLLLPEDRRLALQKMSDDGRLNCENFASTEPAQGSTLR